VELRLVEESKALLMERSHLSDLMANVQKIFRQRMSTLSAENTQVKAALEAAQKESVVILQERDALKAAALAAAESTSAPLMKSSNGYKKRKEPRSKLCRKKSQNRVCKHLFPIHLIWRLVLYV
jgi:hypothetical protein